MSAFLITHSLLSSWLYSLKENPYSDATTEDTSKEDFLRVLRREPTPTTEAMQNGLEFEALVTESCNFNEPVQTSLIGTPPTLESLLPDAIRSNPWFEPAFKIAGYARGGQLQCTASKRVTLRGIDLLLYGRLDVLRAGHIFDIKFSKTYDRGKYIDSTQHPMYLELVPSALDFSYLISNGTDVWTETYRRDETPSIYPIVNDFLLWLENTGLMPIYQQFWGARPEGAKATKPEDSAKGDPAGLYPRPADARTGASL